MIITFIEEGCWPDLEHCARNRIKFLKESTSNINDMALSPQCDNKIFGDLQSWAIQMRDNESTKLVVNFENDLLAPRYFRFKDHELSSMKDNKLSWELTLLSEKDLKYLKKLYTNFIRGANADKTDVFRQRQFLAESEKLKGNEYYRTHDDDKAIYHYTRSLFISNIPYVYVNRAICLYKKKHFLQCEGDCLLAIDLVQRLEDQIKMKSNLILRWQSLTNNNVVTTHIKALHRCAMARIELNKKDFARSDFKKVLELDPCHENAKLMLEKLKENDSTSSHTKDPTVSFNNDQLHSIHIVEDNESDISSDEEKEIEGIQLKIDRKLDDDKNLDIKSRKAKIIELEE